ncbi:MAG: DUF721 domain-containing protein, partial [Methylobacillus sp.]|nr:DUF721 domain-containing protein [Methylobacillus sp.]
MRRLKSLFKDHTELHALATEADKHNGLQRLWEEIIPEPLRPHTHAGGIKHRRLTVFATNGAVAARLKLTAPTLLKDLQNKGLEVTSIRVEVHAPSPRGPPPRRQAPPPARAPQHPRRRGG